MAKITAKRLERTSVKCLRLGRELAQLTRDARLAGAGWEPYVMDLAKMADANLEASRRLDDLTSRQRTKEAT